MKGIIIQEDMLRIQAGYLRGEHYFWSGISDVFGVEFLEDL